LSLSLGLYALCAASLAGACLYFFFAYVPGRRAAAIKAWQQELVVRADLHKMTLDHWVDVGMADADILAAYPTPRALIADREGTLTASRAADAAAHLREVAERFARMRGYHRFVLLDTSLRIVVGVGAAAQLERSDLQAAAEVLAQGKTIVDFHRYADGRVAVVFLARVGADTASRTGGGVVLLEADPSKWLYPYLRLRPIAAASAETLLVKGDGDDIVFLSPLRQNPAPPLTFRRPANAAHFAATAAVKGRGGFDAFVDYRNEPVLAAVAKLDRAPWGIVVKVDQREALASYQQEVRRTGATAAAAIVGFWALVFLLVLGWRRRAEMALGESEGKYRSLVEQANETIYVVQGGRIVFTNRVGAELVGYSEQEIASKPFVEFIHPDDRAMVAERHQRRLKGEELGSHYSFRVIAKNGDIKWVEIGTALISYCGNPAMLNLLTDITARKQAEEATVQANSLLQRTFDAIPDLLTVHDRDLRVVLSNWHGRAHVTEEERNSRPHCYSGYMRRDRPCEPCPTLEVFRTGAPVTAEVVNPHTGKILEVSAHPVTDASGAIYLVTEHVRDITERRRAEAALRESESRFRDTFERSTVGQSLTGPDGKLLNVNQAFADMLGLSIEELEQVTFVEITHPDDIAKSRECIRSLFAGERATYRMEKRYRHRDGHFVFADMSTTLLRDDHGAPLCLITSVVDITERKRAEAALAAANSELERRVAERTAELTVVNRELESFASSVSHDLRAPLRGIDGWSQAVLEDCGPQLDERGRTYLATVRSETHRMAELIDGLLELSRVTRAPMKRETVDLTAMAQELEASLRASQPERAVDSVIAPGMVAEGDAVLLRAVLQNLLANAWKFTGKRPRARIEVGCTSEPGRTVYHVRDDGAGFDMRYAGKLFAPFQRLHSFEEFTGTGIGLATVQRIIHRHGGKVWATAEVDQGATFYFTLTA
jgi:PAS domain S-box-containing protein